MARISFRQGIVRHGKSPGQAFFLQQNGQFVDLVISPDLTLFAFADGNKDYLFTESVTAIKAWGPFSVSQNYWLYLDINRVTGIRTYGSTTLVPVSATTAPALPVVGQMWFDTSTGNATSNKMHEYNGASWVQVLRVFAGILSSGNQFLSPVDGVSVETNFTGSQIGPTGTVTTNAGSLVFDSSGKPIVNQSAQFFTTEDVFTTGVPTGASLKVNNILIRAQSIQTIAPYQVVVFSNFNRIALASPFDFLDKVYGIVEEATPINDIANVITEGIIFNELWDFVSSTATPPMVGSINDPIYVTSTGELTTDITFSIPGQVPIGAIIGLQSILFSPGLYGAVSGAGAAVDHGSLTGLGDDDHPQYFNQVRGDVRYYERTIADSLFAQAVHTHTKSDITDFAHTHVEADITDLDKYAQAQVDNLLNSKVSIDGSIAMTGALTLPADPTSALEAVTKQYVDAVAAGIDAKASVSVTTTFDLTAGSPAATYNPIGGTGVTGEFTNVDITNLDGILGLNYDFNLNQRILVKEQTDARQNGIYSISVFGGSPYTSATIERAVDQDGTPQSEVSPGNFTFSGGGILNSGTGFVVLAGTASGINDTIILNTDDMNWAEVSSSTSFTPGLNIDITSNVISVKQASALGTVDAKTWDGESIVVSTGSPAIVDNEVLLYNSATTDWRNGFLPFIRNVDNTSNVTIDTVTGDVNVLSSGLIDLRRDVNNRITLDAADVTTLKSVGNIDITTSGALNLQSTGNTTLSAGTSTFLLNNATDATLTTFNGLNINTTNTGRGRIVLNSGAFVTILEAGVNTGNNTFILPPNGGSSGQLLSTSGTGITSWIDPPTGGGGNAFCLQDTDGDTFVEVGFGASPTCADSGSNIIQIQAGDAQTFGAAAGAVNILSGLGFQGGLANGDISLIAPPAPGPGTNAGGNVILRSGAGYGDDSGNIDLLAASPTLAAGSSAGHINISAGTSLDAIIQSGDVNITAGSTTNPNAELSVPTSGQVSITTQHTGTLFAGQLVNGGDIFLRLAGNDTSAGAPGFEPDGRTGSIKIQNSGINAGETPDLRFYQKDNLKYVALKAPSTIVNVNDMNITLPDTMGVTGQVVVLNTVTGVDAPTSGVDYAKLDFTDQPYDVAGQGFGTLADGDVIMRFVAVRNFEISALGHNGFAATAPTGTPAVFDITTGVGSPLTTIGTVTFAAGSQTTTLSGFTATGIVPGDVITITCTTASAIADVAISLAARVT